MQLALFDFDGTITEKDSLADFIQYVVGKPRYYNGLFKLSPMLIFYILKLIPNYTAKEKLFAHFFKGWDIDRFKERANQYSLVQIDKIIRAQAIRKIIWHQRQGHKVVIVSASINCWLKAWCEKHKIELIATKLEVKDNKITGKFVTRNCYGIEKVKRIKEMFDMSQYDYIYAYGDSNGDKSMLDLADESFYKPFRD